MPHVVQTHINALYADLKDAKQAAAIAQARVEQLEDQIIGRGGVVPGEEAAGPDAAPDEANAPDGDNPEDKPKKGWR